MQVCRPTTGDSCDGGISVLHNCLSWYNFVNTHLYHSEQLYNIHLYNIWYIKAFPTCLHFLFLLITSLICKLDNTLFTPDQQQNSNFLGQLDSISQSITHQNAYHSCWSLLILCTVPLTTLYWSYVIWRTKENGNKREVRCPHLSLI